MELIRTERRSTGFGRPPRHSREYFRIVGIFRCPYCNQLVERKVSIGLKMFRCGCVNNSTKHGLKNHPLYKVWKKIRERCNNSNYREFHLYGGRGITVCPEWDDAKTFVEWAMFNGYEIGLEIDRRDNSRGYSPDNCRFVTGAVNSQNSRNTKLTASTVLEIRRLFQSGKRKASIARQFNVSGSCIGCVIKGKTWRNIL